MALDDLTDNGDKKGPEEEKATPMQIIAAAGAVILGLSIGVAGFRMIDKYINRYSGEKGSSWDNEKPYDNGSGQYKP